MGGRADAPADILERGGLMTESETEFEAEGDSPGVPPGELEVVALDARRLVRSRWHHVAPCASTTLDTATPRHSC